MTNKKALEWFGQFVVGLIIAVMGLILIFYTGRALIGLISGNNHLDQAEGTLSEIVDGVEELKVIGDVKEVIMLSPKDWWFSVWPRGGKYPPLCGTKPCICISKKIPFITRFEEWNTRSDSSCKTIEGKNLNLETGYFYRLFKCREAPEDSYQIDPPVTLKISLKQGNEIYIEKKC